MRTLTAQNRCDRCSAQAMRRFEKGSLTIDLCIHHTNENADGLKAQGFVLVVMRELVQA